MTCVIDAPVVIIGDGVEVNSMTCGNSSDIHDPAVPVIVGSTDKEDDEEQLDIEEFDDDDFDDEFDDDFEDEDEGEYDVVEEFEDDFTFVDPATKKPVTHNKDDDAIDDSDGKSADDK
ncbi:MAG: hypothetical protein ACKVK0_03295 [Pirellulales bacterium]|jgi:hypothetical protein|tara:strand:+ start:476 stop:829 length:354 start_codon:yes stop_codon:yes gene_type:complete